jgi:hypothetical protein
MKKIILLMLLVLCDLLTVQAQDLTIPQPSTTQTITQDFGLGKVTLTYSRPNVKGRKIFGYMEPYGIVWRMGANSATTIKFTEEVTIEGHKVPVGVYGFFSIPGETEWTFILNKTAEQWGAYNYKESDDVVRFNVPRGKSPRFIETLTMQFAEATNTSCSLQLDWENTELVLHFTTDMDARVMANIDQAMQGAKKPYYFAAIYYFNHDKDIKKALEWITQRDKDQPNSFNVKYWKARIELKAGDKKSAIITANEGLKLATESNVAEYIRLNKEVIALAGSN